MSAPRWTHALLARLAEAEVADEVVGDLEEAHARRVVRHGRALATLLTTIETLDMAVALWRQQTRVRRRLPRRIPPNLEAARRRRMPPLSLLDFKLGLRMLARYPGMTLVGGAAMALGIALGASGLHLFRELVTPERSYAQQKRIVGIQNVDTRTARVAYRSIHDFERWRTELRTVEGVSAIATEELNFAPEDELPAPVRVGRVSASAFTLSRMPPVLGRTLLDSDEDPDAPPVAVLSHWLWATRFGEDSTVVGRVAMLGGVATTVVGVMPAAFQIDVPSGDFIYPFGRDLWTPLKMRASDYPVGDGPSVRVLGRLAPGVTLQEAQTELGRLAGVAATEWPETHGFLRTRLTTFSQPFGEGGVGVLRLLSLSSVFVILVMVLLCANVALMMYARAATRESELVVRSALGASRARIVGQLFAEAVALAALAATAGLAAATWGVRWVWGILTQLAEIAGGRLPAIDLSIDDTTILAAVGLAFVGAVVAGVLPGLKVTRRSDQVAIQQQASRGSAPPLGRTWGGIIVTQVALTTMIVPLAALMGWGAWATADIDFGLPAGEYLTAQMEMDGDALDRRGDDQVPFDERYRASYAALRERLASEPGVTGVTVAENLPGFYHRRWQFDLDDSPVGVRLDPGDRAQVADVDGDFFSVFGVELLAGRTFGSGDYTAGARAVIVNESFVDHFLGGASAVGRRIRFRASPQSAWGPEEPEWLEIVGVVRDILTYYDPGLSHNAGVYQPLRPGGHYPLRIAVHVPGGPAEFAPRLRAAARDVAPALRLMRPIGLDRANEANEISYRSVGLALVLIGIFAILLTNAGIYAIISFTVVRRTREIGVRVALGADRAGIVATVLTRMARRVAIGVATGGALGLLIAYGASDGVLPLTAGVWMAGTSYLLGMVAVCMAACVVPREGRWTSSRQRRWRRTGESPPG